MEIKVSLTKKTFRRFAFYDLLVHRKQWKSPVFFALFFSLCAGVCFWMHEVRGAVLLGGVLLAVGLGLPCVYFATFFHSVRLKARALDLEGGRTVYRLTLPEKGDCLRVTDGKETAEYPWQTVFHAYRDKRAVYLYITAARAFILPFDCLEGGTPQQLWALLTARLPAEKRTE